MMLSFNNSFIHFVVVVVAVVVAVFGFPFILSKLPKATSFRNEVGKL